MGHVYRVVDLSKAMIGYQTDFLCTHNSLNAFDYLNSLSLNPILQKKKYSYI